MKPWHFFWAFVALICVTSTLQFLGFAQPLAGGVIGGLFTLLTVSLTINSGRKQFEETLANDRKKVTESREFEAKQKAFIRAADAFSGFIQMLSSFPTKDLPGDGSSPETKELSLALTNLHFYAEMETIEMVTRLNVKLLHTYLDSLEAKKPSIYSGAFVDEKALAVETLVRQQEFLRQQYYLMANQNIAHPWLPGISEHLKSTTDELAKARSELADLKVKHALKQADCSEFVTKRIVECIPELNALLLRARAELKFKIDEGAYKALMDRQTSVLMPRLQKIYDTSRKEVGGEIPSSEEHLQRR